MATRRPVLCPNCGARVRKNGYCSGCYMHLSVIKKAYNTSNYHYNVGYDKAMARDLSGAIESLNMALRYNKRNVLARNLIGLIHYEMGEVVVALSHWVMSVNYQETNNDATRFLKELKKDATELENVDQLAKKYNMALDYAYRGEYDLAIIQLKSTIALNAHFVKGYLLLALLYIKLENYEKARVTLRRVLKIDKANPVAIHYLHEMGDTDENIIHMTSESVENDGLLDDDFLEEAAATKGDIPLVVTNVTRDNSLKNLFRDIIDKSKTKLVKTGEFGEIGFARYSGLYVLVGLVLGVFLLYFAVVPAQKKKLKAENEKIIKTYSEELADKNTQISELEKQIDQINTDYAKEKEKEKKNKNPLPDYSSFEHGMSDEDINDLMNGE